MNGRTQQAIRLTVCYADGTPIPAGAPVRWPGAVRSALARQMLAAAGRETSRERPATDLSPRVEPVAAVVVPGGFPPPSSLSPSRPAGGLQSQHVTDGAHGMDRTHGKGRGR